MATIKTGDLVLCNRWTLKSLIIKSGQNSPDWTDLGICYVDNEHTEDRQVSVIFVDDNKVEKITLQEFLAEQNLQAVSCRKLLTQDVQIRNKIAEYLRDSLKLGSFADSYAVDLAFPYEKRITVTDSGLLRTKRALTPLGLLSGMISESNLGSYDSQLTFDDLDVNRVMDKYFGDVVPLLPSTEPNLAVIMQLVQDESQVLMTEYVKRLPQVNFKNVTSGKSKMVSSASNMKKKTSNYAEPVQEIPMAARQNRGAAERQGVIDETDAQNARLNKLDQQIKSVPRIKPTFRPK